MSLTFDARRLNLGSIGRDGTEFFAVVFQPRRLVEVEMVAKVRESTKANPSLKNPALYEELREQGASAEKAARISNAQAKYGDKGPNAPSRKGGSSPAYEDWRRDDLYDKAKEIGLPGLSRATKPQLIKALRTH